MRVITELIALLKKSEICVNTPFKKSDTFVGIFFIKSTTLIMLSLNLYITAIAPAIARPIAIGIGFIISPKNLNAVAIPRIPALPKNKNDSPTLIT